MFRMGNTVNCVHYFLTFFLPFVKCGVPDKFGKFLILRYQFLIRIGNSMNSVLEAILYN